MALNCSLRHNTQLATPDRTDDRTLAEVQASLTPGGENCVLHKFAHVAYQHWDYGKRYPVTGN